MNTMDQAQQAFATVFTPAVLFRAKRERLRGDWDGISWDSDLEDVATALEKARDGADQWIRRAKRAAEDGISTWMSDDGSYESRKFRARVSRLTDRLREFEELESLADDARALADDEAAHVERDATAAEGYADEACDAADDGDWKEAVRLANEACALEREYGDDLTWGQLLAMAEAFAEMVAEGADESTDLE
jgi:hypothetical protein